MKKLTPFLAAAALCVAGTAQADLLFDRGLPSQNLNNAAGTNRSNVTWASTDPTGFTGDDFTLGGLGQTFVIDSLVVWGAQFNPLSDDIDNIWLYVGKAGQSLSLVSTGAVTGNTNSNPNITHTFVSYPDGTNTYQGSSGFMFPLAQTVFSNLNLVIEGGVTYNFGVRGDNFLWWNHASNAALSGTPQQGADGKYLGFDTSDLGLVQVYDSNGDGWDKSSDINVQVTGNRVPEPATLSLIGLGLLVVARRVRRRT